MVNRLEETLARIEARAVQQPGDRDVICEALRNQIKLVAFFLFGKEWMIGQEEYPNWIGYGHISNLLQRPGKEVHVYDMTGHRNFENSRKAAQKAIGRAVGELVKTQPQIGHHLQLHIKTGEFCIYTGKWDWRFAP